MLGINAIFRDLSAKEVKRVVPNNNNKRYTDKFKMDVVRAVLAGSKQSAVAFDFGVSNSAVSRFMQAHTDGKLK